MFLRALHQECSYSFQLMTKQSLCTDVITDMNYGGCFAVAKPVADITCHSIGNFRRVVTKGYKDIHNLVG
eukprot:2024990-Amphidinium_carterae.1